jgi:hypothetical protein
MQLSRMTSQLPVPAPRPVDARLLDGTGTIGWIGEQRLGFTGFATLNEAVAAAWVAHVALERRAAKSRREPAPYIESTPQLSREAENEWIEVANERVARLLRPGQTPAVHGGEEAPATSNWFGFEILFPPNTPVLDIDSSAHVVYRGLRRASVNWASRGAPLTNSATVEAAAPTPIAMSEVPLDLTHALTLEVEHAPAA